MNKRIAAFLMALCLIFLTACGGGDNGNGASASSAGSSADAQTPDHTHSYTSQVVQDATCGEDGLMLYTCTVCGVVYTEVIKATGEHDYSSTVVQEPTDTEVGMRAFICKNCETMYTEVIDKIDTDQPAEPSNDDGSASSAEAEPTPGT